MSSSIDIPFATLREWLLARQQLGANYMTLLDGINNRVRTALVSDYTSFLAPDCPIDRNVLQTSEEKLPALLDPKVENFIQQKTSSWNVTTCGGQAINNLDVKELMKLLTEGPEGLATNILGQYSSPHIKFWRKVDQAYSYKNTAFAEYHGLLHRMVCYDIPASKKALEGKTRQLSELRRKINELNRGKSAREAAHHFNAKCVELNLTVEAIASKNSPLVTFQSSVFSASDLLISEGLQQSLYSHKVDESHLSSCPLLDKLSLLYESEIVDKCAKSIEVKFNIATSLLQSFASDMIAVYAACVARQRQTAQKDDGSDSLCPVLEFVARNGNCLMRNVGDDPIMRSLVEMYSTETSEDFITNINCCTDVIEVVDSAVVEEGSTTVTKHSVTPFVSYIFGNTTCRNLLINDIAELLGFLTQIIAHVLGTDPSSPFVARAETVVLKTAESLKSTQNFKQDFMQIFQKASFPEISKVDQSAPEKSEELLLHLGICRAVMHYLSGDHSLALLNCLADQQELMRRVDEVLNLHWQCLKPNFSLKTLESRAEVLEREIQEVQEELSAMRSNVKRLKVECENTMSVKLKKKVYLLGDINRV